MIEGQNRIMFGPYQLVPHIRGGKIHHGLWQLPGGGVVTTGQAYEMARRMGYKPETKICMVRRLNVGGRDE